MLNTTKPANILHEIHSKSEKNLQGYLFAKLYFQAADFKTSERYLSGFLEIRDHHAPAHKLMGQIHETNKDLENALLSYKRSLEIDPHQNEVVLKICDLCTSLPVDYTTAWYWANRAEELYPLHETVFKLRDRFFLELHHRIDNQVLENLIASELAEQPKNISSSIRLLRLYLDTKRSKEAYGYAIMIESKGPFPWNVEWYYLLKDIFEAHEKCYLNLDSQFYLQYLTALDHLILLTLAEPHSLPCGDEIKPCSVKDASAVLCKFDRILGSCALKDFEDDWWNYFINHMKGQLYFYMMCLLLRRTKMYQGNHKEVLQYCSILCAICYTFKPVNLLEETWFLQMEKHRKMFEKFFQLGSLRTSVIGHIVTDMSQEDKDIWLQELKLNLDSFRKVRRRIYFAVISSYPFGCPSYFLWKYNCMNWNLEFPSCIALQEYDKAVYKLCPDSLHHLVWLELHRQVSSGPVFSENVSEIFKGLQYSSKDLYNGSYETLCILDLEASLFASVYQAQTNLEKKSAIPNPKIVDFQLSFPPDVADALCSKQQASWWRAAYALHTCSAKEKFGEFRLELQHGLEVIRGIGNHSMEIQLIAYLARMFADKAEFLMKDLGSGKNERKLIPQNIAALQSRSLHYWNIVLQTLRTPKEQFFTGFNNTLTKDEIEAMQEGGKLYVAVHFLNSDKLDEAAELLSTLSTPYGSYYLALTLKRLASQEDHFSKTKAALLARAKKAVLETRDRIKDDKNHSSNQELHALLEDFETELAIDLSMSYFHGFEDIDVADDSSPKLSSLLYNTPSTNSTTLHSTHNRSRVMTLRTKNQPTNQEYNEQLELNSERMEAQLKALAFNQNTLMKSLVEQQKSLLETNKSICEAVKRSTETLKRLKKSIDELKTSETGSKEKDPSKKPNHKDQDDEDSNTNKSLGEFKISQANNGDIDTSKTPNHRKSQDDDDSNSYVLFEDRAELFTCVDQEEWKKYGISTVKILHNEVRGQVRILIRDQVKNVITIKKHYLSSDVKIKPCPFSNQAWSWNAQDFVDGDLRPALFCSHFGTVELSVAFKAAFDAAICKESKGKKIASPSSTVSQTLTSSSPKSFQFSKTGLWTCPYTNTTTPPPITAQFSNGVSVSNKNATSVSTTTVTSSSIFQFLNSSCNLVFSNSTLNNKSGNQNIDFKISQANMTTSPLFGEEIQKRGNETSIANSSVGNSHFHEFSTNFHPKSHDTITEKPVIKPNESIEKKLSDSDASLDSNELFAGMFRRLSLGCWKCEACQFENNADKSKCEHCNTDKNCKASASVKNSGGFSFSSPSASRFKFEIPQNTDGIAPAALQTVHPFDHSDVNATKDDEVAGFTPSPSMRNTTTSFQEKFQIQGNEASSSPSLEVQDSHSQKPSLTFLKPSDTELSFTSLDESQFSMNFKPQVDLWECQSCLLRNKTEERKCALCGTDKSTSGVFSTKSFQQFIGLNICSPSSPRTQNIALGKVKNPSESTSYIKLLATALPEKPRILRAQRIKKNSDGSWNNEKEGEMSFKKIENNDNANNNQEKGETFFENSGFNYEGIKKEKKILFLKSENNDKQWNVANEGATFMESANDTDRDVEKGVVFAKSEKEDTDMKIQKGREVAIVESDDTDRGIEKEEEKSFLKCENYDIHKNVKKEERTFFCEIKDDTNKNMDEMVFNVNENYDKHRNIEKEERKAIGESKNGDKDRDIGKQEEMPFVKIDYDNTHRNVIKKDVMAFWESTKNDTDRNVENIEVAFVGSENSDKNWSVENEERMEFGKSKDDTGRSLENEDVALVETENDKHRNAENGKRMEFCETKKDDTHTDRNVEKEKEAFMGNEYVDTDTYVEIENVGNEQRKAFGESKKDETEKDIKVEEGVAFGENDEYMNIAKERKMKFGENKKDDIDRNVRNEEEAFMDNEHVDPATDVAKWWKILFREIENNGKDGKVEKEGEMAFAENEKDDTNKDTEVEADVVLVERENDLHKYVEKEEGIEFWERKKNGAHTNVENMKDAFMENKHVDADTNVAKWEEMSFGEFNKHMVDEHVDIDTDVAKWGKMSFEEIENNYKDLNVEKEKKMAFGESLKDDTNKNIKVEEKVAFLKNRNDKLTNVEKKERMEFWESEKDDAKRNVENNEEAFMENELVDADTNVAKWGEMSFEEIENNYKDGNV